MPARRHATPASRETPALPEPSHAERARTLLSLGRTGALSTLSARRPGFPFGSVMPYAADDKGRPILLISAMAMHTQNLAADARASLLVTQLDGEGDPLGAARVTVMGEAKKVSKQDAERCRELYLSRHENARYWAGFSDFSLWRLETVEVYFIGGFGVMGWVSAEDYAAASPDPLAEAESRIITHMNADHADALLHIARQNGHAADAAKMIAVDRLGFRMRLTSGDRVFGARVNFPKEVRTLEEARQTFIDLSRRS